MLEKLEGIEKRFEELEVQMQDPDLVSNRREMQRLGRAKAEIEQIEDQISQVSRKLENPPADPGVVLKLGQEYERLQEVLEQRMEEWAALSEEESENQVPQSRR